MAPHVHYLDNFVMKCLEFNKIPTFLNYANMYNFLDKLIKIKRHSDELKYSTDTNGMASFMKIKHTYFGLFVEGTVKKDHKAFFDFHESLIIRFKNIQPIVLNYKYFFNFKYGYQYKNYILMDFISIMISPVTICELILLPCREIDWKENKKEKIKNLKYEMINSLNNGYDVNLLYTKDNYKKWSDFFNEPT